MSPTYFATLVVMLITTGGLCGAARRWAGPWVGWANKILAIILLAVSLTWVWTNSTSPRWSLATSLPLALCDLVTLVAAAALWWQLPVLVELTYFWGLAGSLQSLLTPNVRVGFPSIEFLEYVVAHAGIVAAALFLVVGQGLIPRRHAIPRVLAITAAYTAMVGVVDVVVGGDYMYLRGPPAGWTLLRVLGPWPWYLASIVGVAVLLVVALDAPFWHIRRATGPPRRASRSSGAAPPDGRRHRRQLAPAQKGRESATQRPRRPATPGPGGTGADTAGRGTAASAPPS